MPALAAAQVLEGIHIGPLGGSVSGLYQDLACNDLVVEGVYELDSSELIRVRDVIIAPGAELKLTGGTQIAVSTTWDNDGVVTSDGTSLVTVTDACSATTTFIGNTSFDQLSATVPGQTLLFTAGSTQTVTGALTLNGVTLRGSSGQGSLVLPVGATQTISNVGVDNVSAVGGQRLAPTEVNQIAGTAPNWFAAPVGPVATQPVPAHTPWGLAVLGAALWGLARRRLKHPLVPATKRVRDLT